MLKTFELKAKSLNCQLLSREHHGRDRFDTWLHPIGAIIHTSHRNEHIHALAISPRMINQEGGFTSSMADLIEPVDPLVAVASSELPS